MEIQDIHGTPLYFVFKDLIDTNQKTVEKIYEQKETAT